MSIYTKIQSIFQHPGFRKYFANTSWLFAEKVLRMVVSLFVGVRPISKPKATKLREIIGIDVTNFWKLYRLGKSYSNTRLVHKRNTFV